MQCWQQLVDNGAEEFIKSIYGDMIIETIPDYNVTIKLDCNNFKGNKEEMAMKIARMHMYMLGAPLYITINKIMKGEKPNDKLIQIDYRPGESFWIKPQDDRVSVIFSITFDNSDDDVIGRVFVNEFSKGFSGCPGCVTISRNGSEPPLELKGISGLDSSNCYATFIVEKMHMQKKETLIDNLLMFRNYLHYHIKCSKAFLHIRMRNKVSALQLILNRAKPEREKQKKTMSGRTFKK